MRRLIRKGAMLLEQPTAADRQRMQELLAARRAPGTKNTDRAFLEGTHDSPSLHAQPDWMTRKMLSDAKRAGIDTTGKVHHARLGHFTDPKAWVSSVADIKRAIRANGMGCEELGIPAPEAREPERVALAEDLVQEEIALRVAADPGCRKKRGELRDQVIEEHSYKH